MQDARIAGTVAPEVDVRTGAMINPHNPDFITRRPWYLGGSGGPGGDGSGGGGAADAGPSLDHQAGQQAGPGRSGELGMAEAERLVREGRERERELRRANRFRAGMWVESLRRGKRPYLMCRIVAIRKRGTVFDLEYDGGEVERGVVMAKARRGTEGARIRHTRQGSRVAGAGGTDPDRHGRETYASKRDAYLGYELDMASTEKRFAMREALRREAKAREEEEAREARAKEKDEGKGGGGGGGGGGDKGENGKEGKGGGGGSDSDSDYDSDAGGSDSEDEFVQKDDAGMYSSRLARQGGVRGAQMKVTARNLRIREDTAKYLRNLDPTSAHYDPKSRSMRDNPTPGVAPDEAQFAGDNFARISGDAVGLAETQLFAWDAEKRGAAEGLHPQANPSQAELLKRKVKGRSAGLQAERRRAVLDKYGGSEYLDGAGGLAKAAAAAAEGRGPQAGGPPAASIGAAAAERAAAERRVRFGASVAQEEYGRDGRVVERGQSSGQRRSRMANLQSKYEEDVHINGHTSVWGSYFHRGAFRWGYADDHSLMRNTYCTGAAGRAANDEANELAHGTGTAGSAAAAQARAMLKAIPQAERAAAEAARKVRPSGSRMYGEADQHAELDRAKVREELRKAAEREEGPGGEIDGRKRKYNSATGGDVDVTEEEMEAFRLRKERSDDPMARLADSGELLEYK